MANIEKRYSKTGLPSYRVQVRLKGHPIQTATFKRMTDAKRWEQQTEAAIKESRYFKTVEAKKHTLGDLVNRYIKDVLPTKPKQAGHQQQQLEWWKSKMGSYALADITTAMIVQYRDELGSGLTYRGTQRSPATVVRYMAALSHAFTIAVSEWQWLEVSPMSHVKKPTEPRGRVRFLNDNERTRLLAACKESSNPWLYLCVVLALSTGMRRSELFNLKWPDLNLKDGYLILHETKNGTRRRIPLAGLGLELLNIRQFIIQLHAAYGFKGLLALGFYVASVFSHLIFEHYNFFPFLSLYGHAHVGKSYMSRLLNRCFFVDSEGNTMTSANTAKGELRKISQKSSIVCALLEGRDGKSRFDFDSILPLYNRNTLYSRATTSQDNRTHDLPLKAALSFVWNQECFTLKAAKERVISLHFSEDELNEDTGKAWTQLTTYSPEQLAGMGHYVLTNRKYFEDELVNITKSYADLLKEQGIAVTRIAENHAIALAGIVALMDLQKMNEISFNDLTKYTLERALHKVDTAKTDSHLADYFFESIRDFNTVQGVCVADNQLVVHLPTALIELQKIGNGFPNKNELIGDLKRHDRFISVKSSRALGSGEVDKCYHFKP